MTPAAITLVAGAFFWVVASLTLVGAWCAAVEIALWRQRRDIRKRADARRGMLHALPDDRERER